MKEYELKPENGKSFFVGEKENDSSIELDSVRGYLLLLKKTCYEEGFKAGYESAAVIQCTNYSYGKAQELLFFGRINL